MATNKEIDEHLQEVLGEVNKQDIMYVERELRQGSKEADVANKGLIFVFILGIIELIVPIVLLSISTINIEPDFVIFFIFYTLTKDAIVGCIFANAGSEGLASAKAWTVDKIRIAETKICLAKQKKIKSNVDLSDFDLRKPSVLDKYNPKFFG